MGASGEIFRAKKRGKEHMKEQQKKKAAPVLVVLILIVLVGAAGIVSFLINRYKPGTEYMAGNEYFNLTDENSVALIQNGELLEEQAVLIGGEPYAAYTYVESQLNSCFYWDEETKGILLTTSGGVQTLLPGDAAVAKTPGGQPAVQQESDGTVYISLDVVKEYTDLDYAYYSDPNRVVIRNEWDGVEQATVQSDTAQVRQKGGIKSLILADVQKGDTLLYLENLDNWCKVMTADGYTGYIQTEDISEPEAIEARTAKKDSYERITRDHKINLVWHQSTSTESNDAMAEMTAEMTGVNVISPTWFSVTDETGTISSLASADYVKLAHEAGREVWGLIDNFNEAFDETTDLAYASVRSRIIEQLLAEAASCGMDGINVDFENLKEAGIPHYLQFLRELTSAAHAQNLVVSVDTPVPQAYTMYYQRGEQARFVDYMIVMAYDEHFAGSEEAGSVSSLPFVQQAVEEMTRVMPADQVICGIPFYTRVWTEKFGQSAITSEVLGMDGAKNYAKENQMTETWDASLGQNVATVETSDARYTIWMEDEQSMEEKLKVIQSADLAGVAEWKLGFECADVWSLISKYIETNS
ncbi:glycosyl hydrolase family 18 [Blautia sp. OM06-15AC]|jgi:spore germination protein YaaH|nr:glycosyl hydrolase family 18 [Fusicatenibacter saccharivorans]RHP38251.1 glycosyl hydrolase family 18 [Blautia sp. AF34-10]RHV10837.1 glycosyl hydrolase family 18 [Blautia sp. OM06-15AC]RHV26750.1 glycosyl hydrolase family 18 [Blautia sp. OM05-6]